MISALSMVTIAVSGLLFASYLYELLLPNFLHVTSVTVDLSDPALQATELGVLLLTLAWFYVGIRDYRFTRRLGTTIAEARAVERELEKKLAGQA